MKKQFYSFLLLLSFAVSLSAQAVQPAKVDSREAALKKHIEYLASDKLEGRRTGEIGATAAADYIAKEFAKIKLKPGAKSANGKAEFLQSFPGKSPDPAKVVTGFNVIGVLEGRDATLKNEAIVIGAHYDHLGRGGEGSLAASSTDIHHGADDNASGTAAVIELAKAFAKEKKNKRTIIFIAFSGEEEGLFGSKYYVNNPTFPIEKTVAMINLDMVGRLNENKLSIGGVGTATEWKSLIETKNITQTGLRSLTSLTNIPSATVKDLNVSGNYFSLQLNEDGFGPSDHSSFYTVKVPVLFFFTGAHVDYHKPSDTAEKINYAGEVKIIDMVAAIARSIDQNPTRPTYTVAKSSNTGGRTGFNVTLGTIPSYTDSATDGLVIDGVRDGSPAEKAGLKGKDKIVKLAGKEIKSIQDYTGILGELKAGEEYEIVVIRDGKPVTMKIVPAKRQTN